MLAWGLALALMPREAAAADEVVASSYSQWEAPVATSSYDLPTIIQEQYLAPISIAWDAINLRPYSRFELHGEAAFPTKKVILLNSSDWNPRTWGQCVGWVNYQTGWNLSGNAEDWEKYVNSHTYKEGAVVVLNMGYWGHVGITLVGGDHGDTFTYRSRNELGKWIVSDSTISKDDPRILGYIVPTN